MKVHKRFLMTIIALSIFTLSNAQEMATTFNKHNNFYISFGAGTSVLRDLPSDIYFDGSTNLQLGFMYERAFHKRFSFLTGIEFEQATYNFNGDLDFNSNNGFDLVRAGPDKKYTGFRQRNLTAPIQGRFYFMDNNASDSRNIFIQAGLRLTQSLDFIGNDSFETYYFYRSRGKDESIMLTDFVNQRRIQLEFMFGFKGQFFKKFDVLNASTLGFMYQLNPIFTSDSTAVHPIHFTWRFLF
ncbi:outer membrane beta-barrel protein [Winogradskyella sp.]|uniref:outer membrane beta-barrel protein n=1 Tax=Winogradskyella sp. TaxID=1883156 RepID=UPI0026188023|nr:outer membrane beta-barrel protein [Winogradskyella sp.]